MFLDGPRQGYVKAVVKDFNFESLHHAIRPLVLFPEAGGRQLLVKLKGNNLLATISFIETKWKALVPYRPFEYRFMDDDFNKLYKSELRLGTIMNVFSTIAVALACMGLIGLSSYAAKQRIKEIGIRKVLGAKVSSIAAALSINFVKLVLIAIVISSPVAWWLMNGWLQDFAYRTTISWWVFVVTGGSILIIAFATVSFQAVKAALVNPVKSLRSE